MHGEFKLGFRSPKHFQGGNSTPSSSTKGFRRKNSLLKFSKGQKSQDYHPEYTTRIVKESVYYDSTNPMLKDESFQQSIPTNQSQDSYNSLSGKKSFRQSNFSNTGFYSQRKRYQHQINLLKKQIEKFKRQIQSKDKQIAQLQQGKAQFKEIQMELVETYRVINYYQGKMKQHQKIVQYLESVIEQDVGRQAQAKLKQGMDFKEIIQFFRNQSIELKGQIQKTNHQNTKLSMKLEKAQKKYQQLEKSHKQIQRKSKNSMTNYEVVNLYGIEKQKIPTIYEARIQSSHKRLAMRRADDQVSGSGGSIHSISSQRSYKSFRPKSSFSNTHMTQEKNEIGKMYGNFNSKINKIEKQLDFFKIENEKLMNELNQKITQNFELLKENDYLKQVISTNDTKKDPMIGVTFGKQFSKQKDTSSSSKAPELSQFVTNMPITFNPISKKQSLTKELPKSRYLANTLNSNDYGQNQTTKIPSQQNKKSQLKNMTLDQLSKKLQQNQTKSYKFKEILPETVRKLRYNLIRQDITYAKLIDIIADKLVTSQNPNEILQVLEDMPYQLTSKQSSSFLFEFRKISAYLKEKELNTSMKNTNQPIKDLSKEQKMKLMKQQVQLILKSNINPFKNVTIRRDASLTSQITKVAIFFIFKTFKNRSPQLEPFLKDKKKSLTFDQAQTKFREQWHLGDEEVDFIFLKSCEQTGQHVKFDFYKTINFFLDL